MRDKFARVALVVLGIIYFSLLFADFIAPYTKDFSDRNQSYAPPSKIFTVNEKGDAWPLITGSTNIFLPSICIR